MSRRRATITQAEIARVIRAARQAGAAEVEIRIGNQSVRVKILPSTSDAVPVAPDEEFVL